MERPPLEAENTEAAGAVAGDHELAAQTAPFAFNIYFHKGSEGQAASQLVLLNSIDGNKKVPPKTLLWVLKGGGQLVGDNQDTVSHPWSFKSTKMLVVDAKSQECMTLADFIEKNGVKTVARHKGPAARARGAAVILISLSTIGERAGGSEPWGGSNLGERLGAPNQKGLGFRLKTQPLGV